MNTHHNLILGAIAGDCIGSVFEFDNIKQTDFPLFCESSNLTDDSILTIATMEALLGNKDFATAYHSYGRRYPDPEPGGYGENFELWLASDNPKPYNSWGNGSAMRVSPVGWAFDTLDEVLLYAQKSAEVTHNHPEGIKGAQAAAAAVFLARKGKTKAEIKRYISETFCYNLDGTVAKIRPDYDFDVSCQGSVPQALIAFLESDGYESAVRLAVSLGGDSDTIACITGGVAEAFYREIPEHIVSEVLRRIPPELLATLTAFSEKIK